MLKLQEENQSQSRIKLESEVHQPEALTEDIIPPCTQAPGDLVDLANIGDIEVLLDTFLEEGNK